MSLLALMSGFVRTARILHELTKENIPIALNVAPSTLPSHKPSSVTSLLPTSFPITDTKQAPSKKPSILQPVFLSAEHYDDPSSITSYIPSMSASRAPSDFPNKIP